MTLFECWGAVCEVVFCRDCSSAAWVGMGSASKAMARKLVVSPAKRVWLDVIGITVPPAFIMVRLKHRMHKSEAEG